MSTNLNLKYYSTGKKISVKTKSENLSEKTVLLKDQLSLSLIAYFSKYIDC